MEPYTPIEPFEVLSEQLGRGPEQIVKLDANENPYGPHPAVREALAAYPFPHIYPDPEQRAFRAALAEYTGVSAAKHLLPAHGADELIDLLCRVFVGPGDAIVNCPPTFGMYELRRGPGRRDVIEVRRRGDFSVDVDGHRARRWRDDRRAQAALPHLAQQPGRQPARAGRPAAAARSAADRRAGRGLYRVRRAGAVGGGLGDGAGEPDRPAHLQQVGGIAGLRLGYGIFPGWLMPALWKAKQPYNVNVAATVAGLASLAHRAEIQTTVDALIVERERLIVELARFPFLRPYPSQANFVLCRVVGRDAKALKEALAGQGILVRHYAKPGLENCIRVSVGRPEQTDTLLVALAGV